MRSYFILLSILGFVVTAMQYLFWGLGVVESLLSLSMIAFLPLYLYLVMDDGRFYRFLAFGYPVFAIGVTISFHFNGMAFIWLLFCILLAFYGAFRFISRGGFYLEETLVDIGLVYSVFGGGWFVVYAYDFELFGFSGLIALLTAIHFHYSSLYVPLFVGLLGRWIKQKEGLPKWYRVIAFLIILSPMTVALGITYSRGLEVLSVVVFGVAVFVYALKSFKVDHIFVKVSSVMILFAMVMAVLYSVRLVTIPDMIVFHGVVNAFGFAGIGLVGYVLVSPKSHVAISSVTISKIKGERVIGKDFFERKGMVAETDGDHPKGMVDSMGIFEREDFRPHDVHPLIRSFYERTVDFDMLVYPKWHPLILPFARIYKTVSSSMEQMNFPVTEDERETEVESRMVRLKDEMDRRSNVRAWVRVDKRKQKAIYAAAYSTHVNSFGERYYNVFFPMPYGGMTSILKIENFSGDGVSLTSHSDRRDFEHQGVYQTIGGITIRLPINETIDVWRDGEVIKAHHDSWLFGVKVLTLDYVMKEKQRASSGGIGSTKSGE